MIIIIIEGADAVGKHTQTERLAKKLIENGHPSALYSFPRYKTLTGQAILRHLKRETMLIVPSERFHDPLQPASDDALAFQALMLMDKAATIPEIESDLRAGKILVFDRWWQSAYAYGGSDGIPDQILVDMHRCLPQGDVNILLDLDPVIAAQRRPVPRDRYEENREKMAHVRERYRNMWYGASGATFHNTSTYLPGKYAVIDANLTEDEVEGQIWKLIEPIVAKEKEKR